MCYIILCRPHHTTTTPILTIQGPTLSPGELCQEMLRRRGAVQREKEREKEQARLEKMKQVSVCVGGSGGGCVRACVGRRIRLFVCF